jgi:hypothetical protein
MNNSLFAAKAYKRVESRIKKFLNEQKEFLSRSTVKSTRAAGDAIQDILAEHFSSVIGSRTL